MGLYKDIRIWVVIIRKTANILVQYNESTVDGGENGARKVVVYKTMYTRTSTSLPHLFRSSQIIKH